MVFDLTISAVTVGLLQKSTKLLAGATRQTASDDTIWLQRALDKGGNITLVSGRNYRVSAPSGQKAALLIGSNTHLDLAGCTLELVPGEQCALIASRDGRTTRNVRISGGSIIGNGTLQPVGVRREHGITPTLYLTNCDNLELRDLHIRNAYMYAIYATGNNGIVSNVKVKGAVGGGIHLSGSRWNIEGIDVRDVTYFEKVNCQGNPFIVSLHDSIIGNVYCENYGFGVKFQDGCENLVVGSIVAIGGAINKTHPDYLVKIQGMKDDRGTRLNRNIRIEEVVARNGPHSGLYVIYSEGVQIRSYLGENNGTVRPMDRKNGADILIIDSDKVWFGALCARGFVHHGLWLHHKTGTVSADSVELDGGEGADVAPIVVRAGKVEMGRTILKRTHILAP